MGGPVVQFSKIKFGFLVVLCSAPFVLTGEGQAQYASSNGGQSTPQQSNVSYRAAALSQDPFDGVNFMACEMAGTDGQSGTMVDSMSSAKDVMSGGGGFLARDPDCKGDVPGKKDASCANPDFKDGAGKFDQAKLDAAIRDVKAGAALASCKVRKAKSAVSVTDCFSNQFKRMKSDMKEVRKDFEAQLTTAKDNIGKLNAAVEKQKQNISKLNGKAASIEKTMAKINAAIDRANASDGTANSLSQIQKEMQAHETQVRNYEREVLNERPRKVAQCFQNGGSVRSKLINCQDAAGNIQSPKECVLRLYRDGVYLANTKGSNVNSPTAARAADQARTTFSEQLDKMMAAMQGQEPAYKSVEALLSSQYGTLLKSKGTAGQTLIDELKNCDWDAQTAVKNDIDNPKTKLGSMKEALAQTATSVGSRLREVVQGANGLGTAMRDAGAEIFNSELNAAFTGNCSSNTVTSNSGQVSFQVQPLRQQLNCAEYLVKSLEVMRSGGILPGTKTTLKVPLNVPGLGGTNAFCENLRDCGTKITKELLPAAQTRLEGLQGGEFVNDPACPINAATLYSVPQGSGACPGIKRLTDDTNRTLESAFKNAAEMFRQRVAVARLQFEKVKKALSTSGINLPPESTAIGDGLTCPDNATADSGAAALCKLPNEEDFSNMLAKAAGAPGLLDTDFSKVSTESNAIQGKYNALAEDLNKNASDIARIGSECKKLAKKEEQKAGLEPITNSLAEEMADCQSGMETSLSNFDEKISELTKELNSVCKQDEQGDCAKLRVALKSNRAKCSAVITQNTINKMSLENMSKGNQGGSQGQGLNQNPGP